MPDGSCFADHLIAPMLDVAFDADASARTGRRHGRFASIATNLCGARA
jgi:hypothetical protein